MDHELENVSKTGLSASSLADVQYRKAMFHREQNTRIFLYILLQKSMVLGSFARVRISTCPLLYELLFSERFAGKEVSALLWMAWPFGHVLRTS